MTWTEVAPRSGIYLYVYDAPGFGPTNSLAISTPNGTIILNPPPDPGPMELNEVLGHTPVIGLVEPHAGHNIGVASWRHALPDVPLYTAPGAVERLSRICRMQFRPISELDTGDPGATFTIADGMRGKGLLGRFDRAGTHITYSDEILIHLNTPPSHPIIRAFFWLNSVKPGFQVNWNFLRLFVTDKKALSQQVLTLISDTTHLVPAHGTVKQSPGDLRQAHELLSAVAEDGR